MVDGSKRWTELIDSEPEELAEPSNEQQELTELAIERKENENESFAYLHRFHEHEEEGTEERNPAQHDNQHIIHPRHHSQPTKLYYIDSEPEELTELAVTTTLHRESHEPGPHCNVLEELSSQWRLLATQCVTMDPAAALHVVPSLELMQNYMPVYEASHRCQSLQLLSGAFAASDAKSQLATILLQTLVILQLACTDIVPNEMITKLADDIIKQGTKSTSDRPSLLLCRNLLAHVMPRHPSLAREMFCEILPEGKRRRTKHR